MSTHFAVIDHWRLIVWFCIRIMPVPSCFFLHCSIQIGPPGAPGTSGPDLEWVPWLPPGLFHGPNPSFLDKRAVYNSRLYIFKYMHWTHLAFNVIAAMQLVAELWWLLAQAGSWIERGVQEPVCELEDRH
ncbi:hypothetical protein C8R44DRAFT_746393 [Mycena epipterygia]|nr:hypothetical protein C8R44DRAFT_746393 [Mycena epipterygia]